MENRIEQNRTHRLAVLARGSWTFASIQVSINFKTDPVRDITHLRLDVLMQLKENTCQHPTTCATYPTMPLLVEWRQTWPQMQAQKNLVLIYLLKESKGSSNAADLVQLAGQQISRKYTASGQKFNLEQTFKKHDIHDLSPWEFTAKPLVWIL